MSVLLPTLRVSCELSAFRDLNAESSDLYAEIAKRLFLCLSAVQSVVKIFSGRYHRMHRQTPFIFVELVIIPHPSDASDSVVPIIFRKHSKSVSSYLGATILTVISVAIIPASMVPPPSSTGLPEGNAYLRFVAAADRCSISCRSITDNR